MKHLLYVLFCLLSLQSTAQGILDSFEISKSINWQGSDPRNLYNFNETLVFTPGDTILGRHYRKTDGSYFPKAIDIPRTKGGANSGYSAHPSRFAQINNTLYFGATDSNGYKNLYKYDNTNSAEYIPIVQKGTKDSLLFNSLDMVTSVGNHICFRGFSNKGNGLCVYNTVSKDAILIDSLQITEALFAYNGKVYFAARTISPFDNELYEYDPIHDVLTKYDLVPFGSSNPHALIVHNGVLYFLAAGKLYQFDNTTMPYPQTRNTSYPFGMSFSLKKTNNSLRNAMCIWGNKLLFVAYVNYGNYKLFEHDFSTNKNKLVDSSLKDYNDIAVYNNKLFFAATDSVLGYELYMYDGTNPPTLVADIYKGAESSDPHSLTVANKKLFFAAVGEGIGCELFMYSEANVGVQNTKFKANIALYPNPTNGDATLQLSLQQTEAINISLTNLSGQRIYQTTAKEYQQGTHNIVLPTAQLSAGMYLYHITDKNGVTLASGRIEKQ